jgi:indolepyruvate ferredoxin oxidoreductase beta subunit
MAFDDIVRVADLKARASRRARVRREVKAGDADLVKVYDHFKPGVPELAALLPEPLARRALAWDARRQQRGRDPWSLKLVLGTHTVTGLLALRVLASLRWLRRRGLRFAEEQQLIEQWLDAITALTTSDWRGGHEVALCGRLIKGYGATNERGKRNLLHVIDQLARRTAFASPDARADAITAAREAALADEAGTALDQALAAHGAAPREIQAQPIRFVRRRAADASA